MTYKKTNQILHGIEPSTYIIYEINTDEINNLELYKDPNSQGVYSYNYFNPSYMKIIYNE